MIVSNSRENNQASARILTAGVVAVTGQPQRWRFLLLRAYRYWDFPKGEVRPGEDRLAAAMREFHEETGIDRLDFRWGRHYYQTPPYRGGKVACYFLAAAPYTDVVLGVNEALGRPEHHEHRWLSYTAARRRLVPRVQAVLDWAQACLNAGTTTGP